MIAWIVYGSVIAVFLASLIAAQRKGYALVKRIVVSSIWVSYSLIVSSMAFFSGLLA